ncbi:MAG: hypothetical protein IKY98_02020 [Alphaproteobacteria bacterium]|nr:hypothetical protein [Alphaproteobacteria bacterium]
MGIIILRLLVIFYVAGILFLIVSLGSKDIVEKKRSLLGLFAFPILLFSQEGRTFLSKIIKGEEK